MRHSEYIVKKDLFDITTVNGHVKVMEHGQDLNQFVKVNLYDTSKVMKVGSKVYPLLKLLNVE